MSRARRAPSALLALLALVVPACASSGAPGGTAAAAPPPAGAELPVTVESVDGRLVEITDTSRIVPLAGNIAEIVFALGAGDQVVGRDISATFPEAAGLPLVTRAHDVSAESVLSLRPTLVIADEETGPPEALDQIRNVGVPVLVLERPSRVEDVGSRIERIATALGLPDAAGPLVDDVADRLGAVRAGLPGGPAPRVAFLYVRGQAAVYLLGGPGSGPDSLIAHAGGEDAGTAIGLADPFTPITSEAMVRAAPDVLLLTTSGLDSVGGVEGLVGIPGIAQTPAGRDRRVITVEDGLLFSFSSRTPDAIAHIAEQMHAP